MSFRDLAVLLGVGVTTAPPYAISLAAALEAHLTGLALLIDPAPPNFAFIEAPYSALQAALERARSEARGVLQAFETDAGRAGLATASEMLQSDLGATERVLEKALRHFDLTVVEQQRPDVPGDGDLMIEVALFGSGRPVIVVPYIQKDPFKLDTVMVAWDGSLVSARALGDALPLLTRARRVEVVTVAKGRSSAAELRGFDIAQHLARHQVETELRLVHGGNDIAETLLSHAADVNADLLVMGGYGHSRLREFVLGGTTRTILESMTLPVFMSH